MPIEFEYHSATNFVRTTVSGPVLDSDPIAHLERVLSHPDYRPGLSALVSCKEVYLGSFSTKAVRALVQYTRDVEARLQGARVAVSASQPAVFGLLRMYELIREPPFEFGVFRSHPEAEAWLSFRIRAA